MNSVMTHSRPPIASVMCAVLAGVALSLGTAGCGGGAEKSKPEKQADAPSPAAREVTFTTEEIQHGGVTWSAVQEMTVAAAVELPGQLQPDENKTVRVSTPSPGRLLTVRANVGDRVARGQVLATVQSEGALSARADSAKAVAELHSRQTAATYARLSRERAERLLEMKAGSRQDVERARTDDEMAQAAVAQAQAEIDRAKDRLGHLNVDAQGEIVLRSAIGGVVLSRDAVPGSVVEPGAPLLTITDPSTLWLQIAATEAVASTLRPAALVRFSVPAFPDEPFEARVQNIGGALNPETRTLPVRAIVANASGRLRPEMFATVRIDQGTPRKGVGVPDAAVQLLDERPVVFVARPDAGGGATFERRDVGLGAKQGGKTQIVDGLRLGDVVVTDGTFAVKSQFSRSKLPS
ncbi:MAG: efflux RND transporter periplasmic adaptor subunit [Acidobacteriota bacterium]